MHFTFFSARKLFVCCSYNVLFVKVFSCSLKKVHSIGNLVYKSTFSRKSEEEGFPSDNTSYRIMHKFSFQTHLIVALMNLKQWVWPCWSNKSCLVMLFPILKDQSFIGVSITLLMELHLPLLPPMAQGICTCQEKLIFSTLKGHQGYEKGH